jgi:hypothetical protein
MVNYGNGKIYKVICSATGRVYIGSTTQPLSKRMAIHRAPSNKCMTKDFINGKIFLIEDYCCDRKEQLESRERFHIESNDCVNLVIPTRTSKEYCIDKKEHRSQVNKVWRQKNKELLKESDKIRNKEYYKKNKDQVSQKSKEYREKNKELISQKAGEKFDCECGGKYTHHHKTRHLKTNKHQAYLSSIV